MTPLSPSATFSPSIARQQLAIAKDWNYIDGWLNTKFNGRSAPPFERNNDTLKALLALAAVNESADEDCALMSKLEVRNLKELELKEANDPDGEIFKALEHNFTCEGHASLEALSSAGVLLHQSFVEISHFAQKILDLQITSFNLDQVSDRVALLCSHLRAELKQVTALVHELRGDAYQPSLELSKQITEYQRKIKVLATKVQDITRRPASLSGVTAIQRQTIQDVKIEEEKFTALMATVKALEAQVKDYYGLPHDTDLARLELEELRIELTKLTKERDTMFEGLVERESPKKAKLQRS